MKQQNIWILVACICSGVLAALVFGQIPRQPKHVPVATPVVQAVEAAQ